MPPFDFSHNFLFATSLFSSWTFFRFSNLHQQTQMNRTEWGQAQLRVAQAQIELAREQIELAQKQTEPTKTQIKSRRTQMELAQEQMALACAQAEFARQQMPLWEELGSSPTRVPDKPFTWHIF